VSTAAQVLREGVRVLTRAGVENAQWEAKTLFRHAFSFDETTYILRRNDAADKEKTGQFLGLVEKRKNGMPLHYLLGVWPFAGLDFFVGEGVLIPRPETELLVSCAEGFLSSFSRDKNPVVFDLCAGSGCVGLSVAVRFPQAEMYLLEKSEAAFGFLKKNKARHGCTDAVPLLTDIKTGFLRCVLPGPDLILCNPPYVETGELPFLQREVLQEPREALDGGADGLFFYRILAEKWMPYINSGGVLAVECGMGQAETVASILGGPTEIAKDLNGVSRVVLKKSGNHLAAEGRKYNDFIVTGLWI
jgi:release factor glutamine methyltransferase